MVTIDTEFKSDLASIQQHINDLDSKATTLNDCVSDFSGVRKRVNSAWPSGKTADAADVEMYNYAADLEDACNDIKIYKGYVQSLYDALTPVKDELEAMRGNAEDNDLEIKNNVIQEPEKPGNGASNGDKKDYDFKVRVFNRLKERSKKARDDEASAFDFSEQLQGRPEGRNRSDGGILPHPRGADDGRPAQHSFASGRSSRARDQRRTKNILKTGRLRQSDRHA